MRAVDGQDDFSMIVQACSLPSAGAVLINVARGAGVDEDALVAALTSEATCAALSSEGVYDGELADERPRRELDGTTAGPADAAHLRSWRSR